MNKGTLCSDSHTSCGTALTNPASTAPAPMETIRAGKAQQMRVLADPNSVRAGSMLLCRRIAFSPFNIRHCITSILD